MFEKADELKKLFAEKSGRLNGSADVEQLRIEFLGKKGYIQNLMQELRNIPNEQKKEAGQRINEMKQYIEKSIADRLAEIKEKEIELLINSAESYDETMPVSVDFGSYPFVTSSNTICAGACTGLGIGPNKIGEVFGIMKAYCTRVGAGPFPTELFDETGKKMRDIGHEYGAVTGRERRCGWIDLVALRYSIMVNGVTQLIMMKSDVLDTFPTIKACTAYKVNGVETRDFPYDIEKGISSVGVNKDDLNIKLDGLQMRSFSSQGQQRSASLALKLAELDILRMFTSSTPILLLDDVFSELDADRRASLLSVMKDAQIFITCTDRDMATRDLEPMKAAGTARYYHVSGGTVTVD